MVIFFSPGCSFCLPPCALSMKEEYLHCLGLILWFPKAAYWRGLCHLLTGLVFCQRELKLSVAFTEVLAFVLNVDY